MTSETRIPELDGLRGLAILLVLVFHTYWFPFSFGIFQPASEGLMFWVQKAQLSGWIGVDLFFALSGFLITRLLMTEKTRPQAFRRFYIRRALRIFPPYFLLLTLWFWLRDAYPPQLLVGDGLPAQLSLWTYTSNWMIALNGWERIPVVLAHTWTLAIEEQFYLLWPLVIIGLERRNALRVCLALLVLCPLLRWALMENDLGLVAYVLTPSRLDALACGGALALMTKLNRTAVFTLLGLSFLTLIAIFISREGLRGEDPLMLVLGLSTLALFFTAAIAVIQINPVNCLMKRTLRSGPLRWLGKYSYGTYLYHQPILLLLLFYGYRGPALYYASGMILPIAVAILSYQLWERWFLQLKARWA